jgi:hypothetical protein
MRGFARDCPAAWLRARIRARVLIPTCRDYS